MLGGYLFKYVDLFFSSCIPLPSFPSSPLRTPYCLQGIRYFTMGSGNLAKLDYQQLAFKGSGSRNGSDSGFVYFFPIFTSPRYIRQTFDKYESPSALYGAIWLWAFGTRERSGAGQSLTGG